VLKIIDFVHRVARALVGSGTAAFASGGLAAVVELGVLPLQWRRSGCGIPDLQPLRRHC
jgi:hypothetical protein